MEFADAERELGRVVEEGSAERGGEGGEVSVVRVQIRGKL